MKEKQTLEKIWKISMESGICRRWSAFDIRFEAYGKDIMDSVKVNDWVADDVLNFPHPHHIKYEMFLTKVEKRYQITWKRGNISNMAQIWNSKINTIVALQENHWCKRA